MLKEQVDAPKTGQADQRKDDAADHSIHTAEDPAHQIELEQTHQAPVDSADNYKE